MGRRLAVLDLSMLVSRPLGRLDDDCNFLIPDDMMGEVLTSNRAAERTEKFWEAIRDQPDRFFVGHTWKVIHESERIQGIPARVRDIVNPISTVRMRTVTSDFSFDEITDRIMGCQQLPVIERSNGKRQEFYDDLKKHGSDNAEEADKMRRRSNIPGEQEKYVRDPNRVLKIVEENLPQMLTKEMKQWLYVFPDRFALGRWARCFVWSRYKQLIGHTKGRGNDWDDAQYALLASYCGCLLTKDKGLKEMVEMVFPGVEVRG